MEDSEALGIIITRLRQAPDGYPWGAYDVYLPTLWEEYVRERDNRPASDSLALESGNIAAELSPAFYAAAWELCRRGFLRPGAKIHGDANVNLKCQAGDGYSLMPRGRQFLAAAPEEQFVAVESGRTGNMLGRFAERFGHGYHQRSQEAVKCYNALAYLACCAMSGAATESILLAVAIAKSGDEERVLHTYRAAQGRRKLVNDVVGRVADPLAGRFKSFMDLLNYWRDETAHGQVSSIVEIEAFDALGRLLRFAHLVDDGWDALTN